MVGIDWLSLPTVAVIGMTFMSGLALGASRTPRDVMVKDAAPPGQIGKVFGFVSAGLPLGSAVTPVPFGILIDNGHPELVLVLVAVILLLSLLCAGSARVFRPGRGKPWCSRRSSGRGFWAGLRETLTVVAGQHAFL